MANTKALDDTASARTLWGVGRWKPEELVEKEGGDEKVENR